MGNALPDVEMLGEVVGAPGMTGPTGAGCTREWPGARLGTHNRYFSQGFQLNLDTFPIPPLLLIQCSCSSVAITGRIV